MTEPEPFADLESTGSLASTIPVHISYEIIRLFSEGLYQSPHKAIEELVSNGYDAGATSVHVLMPQGRTGPATMGPTESPAVSAPAADNIPNDVEQLDPAATLWVIDNGCGMTQAGFHQLWHVAHSEKANVINVKKGQRAPIGQFGIGKLAAYVLAWRLTHISCADGEIHLTSMDFKKLEDRRLDNSVEPFKLALRKIDEGTAKGLLADVEVRDPQAWSLMFGDNAASSWTAAAMTDFKALYQRLYGGRLAWVLRTGLPLHTNFQIWLNGTQLESSKLDRQVIKTVTVGGADDTVAAGLGLARTDEGIAIPGIVGTITGSATVYQERLTTGKSEQYGRSNGFFVRARGRVINLEDELFGLDVLNHAVWSRFAMSIDADGLRDHLLSSREGVRDSETTATLRKYLLGIFNLCRQAFDEWIGQQLEGLDLQMLLSDAPSLYVTEPLVTAVTDVVARRAESFYITQPEIDEGTTDETWLATYAASAAEAPFKKVIFENTGKFDRALRYIPETQTIVVNLDHPFVDKMMAGGKSQGHVTLFSSAEVFIDALMREHGVPPGAVVAVLEDRDRILRLLAGDQPSTAAEVLRMLDAAIHNSEALERVVGPTFRVLGFEYERRGGNAEGCDGTLYARLGRIAGRLADYKVVYDAKQTDQPSVPAAKVKIDSLEDFRREEKAHFGFFLAKHFEAERDAGGKLNREITAAVGREKDPAQVTLLRAEDLKRIVTLHYEYGLTLTRLRTLFETAHTVLEVEAWIDRLAMDFEKLEPRVPLKRLLDALEQAKLDTKAEPNVHAVRATDDVLKEFEPEKLIAALQAVETIVGRRWIEVESGGEVRLHHTSVQIVGEVERGMRSLRGLDAREPNRPAQ